MLSDIVQNLPECGFVRPKFCPKIAKFRVHCTFCFIFWPLKHYFAFRNNGLAKTRSGKFCTTWLNISSIKKTLTDLINWPWYKLKNKQPLRRHSCERRSNTGSRWDCWKQHFIFNSSFLQKKLNCRKNHRKICSFWKNCRVHWLGSKEIFANRLPSSF